MNNRLLEMDVKNLPDQFLKFGDKDLVVPLLFPFCAFLKMIPYVDIFNSMSDDMKIDTYFISGVSGTLPTFLIIDNIMTQKSYIDKASKSILSAACRNADNRILKFILSKISLFP